MYTNKVFRTVLLVEVPQFQAAPFEEFYCTCTCTYIIALLSVRVQSELQ